MEEEEGGGGGVIVERIKRGSKEKQSSEETITGRCGNCFRGLRKWLSRRAGGKAIRKGIQRVRSWVRRHVPGFSSEQHPKKEHVTLDRYELGRQLGYGAFGKVILAKDKITGQEVALKRINKWSVMKDVDTVMAERRVLELASGCPFLNQAYAAFQTEKHLYFVLEYASGGNLHQLIKNCGRLDTEVIRFMAAELICGIQFLHSKGIVHRDLKPGNILLSSTGHVMIADFGISLENMFDGQQQNKNYAGTRAFLAPELIRKESYSQSIDWWALGVILYIMATGKHPFSMEKGANEELRYEPSYPQWLDVGLIDLIHRLLRKCGNLRQENAQNIRDHFFFSSIDWEKVQAREIEPPYKLPSVKQSPHDVIEQEATPSELFENPIDVMLKMRFKGFSFVSAGYKLQLTPPETLDMAGPSGTCVNEDKGPPSPSSQEKSSSSGSDKVNEHEGKHVPSKAPQVRHHSMLIYPSTSQARRKAPSTV